MTVSQVSKALYHSKWWSFCKIIVYFVFLLLYKNIVLHPFSILFYMFSYFCFWITYSGELSIGTFHAKKEFVKNLQAVCHGDKHHNCRAMLLNVTKDPATHVLTVEEQVDCLVDMATDGNILGRIFIGWSPWIWLVVCSDIGESSFSP